MDQRIGANNTPTNEIHRSGRLSNFSRERPIRLFVSLVCIALLFRIVDIFVLRLDERLGEIILSKALGFVLVLGFLWILRKPISSIGLHSRNIDRAVLIGGIGTILLFAVGYGVQVALLSAAGTNPEIVFAAIDPKTGMAGGTAFTLFLVVGNVVNSFIEEGLFRGVALPQMMRRHSFWRANAIQASLFGLWHLVWPLKSIVMGRSTIAEAATEAVILLLATTAAGLAFGYLFYKTGNLWTPWLAHTINNTVLNIIHIRTINGLDVEMGVVMLVSFLGYFLLALCAWKVANQTDVAPLQSWG